MIAQAFLSNRELYPNLTHNRASLAIGAVAKLVIQYCAWPISYPRANPAIDVTRECCGSLAERPLISPINLAGGCR